MRTNERLANEGLLLWRATYWIGNIIQLNDTGFVNIEVKYHLESQSKKYYYQSNSFFK